MTLKKVTVGFRMSDTVIAELLAQFPTIIKDGEIGDNHTMFIVDVTQQQEDNIVPILKEKLIRIETVPGGVWPPAPP